MKKKLLFGTGMAAGYVLGSRSGRAAYEKIKARALGIWDSQPVQEKVTAATGAVKGKAPEVTDQLSEAARRATTVISSALHRDDSGKGTAKSTATPATPPTKNVASDSGPVTPTVISDPALDDGLGVTDEGIATSDGTGTGTTPPKTTEF